MANELKKKQLEQLDPVLDFISNGSEELIEDLYLSIADLQRGIERDNYGTVAAKDVSGIIKYLPALKKLKDQAKPLMEALEQLKKVAQ